MGHSVVSFLWLLLLTGGTGMQQSVGAKVEERPADVRLSHSVIAEDKPILLIFLDVLRGTGFHGGFAEVNGCSDLGNGHVTLDEGVSVKQAMDDIVTSNPGYRWELLDGVVNLMPVSGASLMRTKIEHFQITATDLEVGIVVQNLLRLPEVQRRQSALGLQQGVGQGGLGVGDINPVRRQPVPVHINLENLSLQGALNRIVQAYPKGIWIYNEVTCNGKKTYTVRIASDY